MKNRVVVAVLGLGLLVAGPGAALVDFGQVQTAAPCCRTAI